jgi:hypothetical protein
MRLTPPLWSALTIASLLVGLCGCGTSAPAPTHTPVPTETLVPTATATATPAPTATDTPLPTSTATVTTVPTATTVPTPTPTLRPEDRLPTAPNEPFTLAISEEELTTLAANEAAQMVNAQYDQLSVRVLPDGVRVSVVIKMLITPKGVPFVQDGQVRFRVDRLDLRDEYQQLTEMITLAVTGTLERALYFLQPSREAHIRAVDLTVTAVELQQGAMIIRGVTE